MRGSGCCEPGTASHRSHCPGACHPHRLTLAAPASASCPAGPAAVSGPVVAGAEGGHHPAVPAAPQRQKHPHRPQGPSLPHARGAAGAGGAAKARQLTSRPALQSKPYNAVRSLLAARWIAVPGFLTAAQPRASQQVVVDKWNLKVTDVKHPDADVAAMLAKA